jgi:hypothetical protein
MGSRRHPDRDNDADIDEHAVKVAGPAPEAARVKAVLVRSSAGWSPWAPSAPPPPLARLNQRHWFVRPGAAGSVIRLERRGHVPPKGRGTRWEG